MLKTLGIAVALVLLTQSGAGPQVTVNVNVIGERSGAPMVDVQALLAAAQGASPVLCGLAAQSVRGWGWGDASDAPATPLGPMATVRTRGDYNAAFGAEDIERLLGGIASDDACVRELSIRLLGSQRTEAVTNELITRLRAPGAPVRAVAALGLGLVRRPAAVTPLIAVLGDADASVRANGAWALGRIDDGRALAPVVGLFRDRDAIVREAAVVAAGHIDSGSAVPALVRVLQSDESAAVRRGAAWALGQRHARDGAGDALAAALGRESDARAREMLAWAIGNSGERTHAAALLTALRGDADERVRETAAWALAEVGDRSAIDALGTVLETDRSARVRGTAAWAIGNLGRRGTRAPAGLVRLLKDPDDDVRLKAAWALGQVGDSSAIAPINDALKAEQATSVRKALIRALMKSGGRSESVLTGLLTSPDAAVREAAVRGLAGEDAFNPWPWPWPRPRPFP